jgi:2-C-methyl-D-erythritol 2,4-cyclodiphosphate synthase
MELLTAVYDKLTTDKFVIINIDSIIACQEPKMSPHIDKMKENIASVLKNVDVDRISIKATTTEGLGFTGRGEGIAAFSVALLEKFD